MGGEEKASPLSASILSLATYKTRMETKGGETRREMEREEEMEEEEEEVCRRRRRDGISHPTDGFNNNKKE